MTLSSGRRSSPPSKASVTNLILLLLSILALSANAQVTIRGAGAYTQVGGKLYFHGGEDGSGTASDILYVLDLTKSWTTIAPAWSQLRKSPFANSYHVATHSADNKTLYLIGRNDDKKNSRPPQAFVNKYSIDTNTWTVGSVDMVTDVFEPETGRVSEQEIPVQAGVVSMGYYQGGALAWLKNGADSSVYALGGYSPNNTEWTSLRNLFKFSWATETWTLVLTPATTVNPPPRQYHCAASTADGSKAVIFGGWAPPGNLTALALNDLWILDATTLTWKQGASVPRGNVGYPACTMAGNQLIVWGGFQYLNSSPPDATPMRIYDISLDKWMTTYEPTPEYLDMAPPPTNPNNGGNNNGTNPDGTNTGGEETQRKPGLAIILAGVFGAGFVVLAAVLGFVFHRRRQNKRRLDGSFKLPASSYKGSGSGGYSKQRNHSEDKYSDDTISPSSSDMTYNQALARVMDSADGNSNKQQHEMNPLQSPELAMLEAEERASASPGPINTYLAHPYGPGNSPELTAGYYFVPPQQQAFQGSFPYPPVSSTTDRFSSSTYKQEVPSSPTASTFAPTNSVYSVSPNQHPMPSPYPNYLNTSHSNLSTSAHSQSANRASSVPSTHVADSAFCGSTRNTYHEPPEPAAAAVATAAEAPAKTVPRVVRNPQRHPTVIHQQAFGGSEKREQPAPQQWETSFP
ncbi:F-box only protein 42 [Podila horticola]|nr:F-box only protein 42 [Podila horticola]